MARPTKLTPEVHATIVAAIGTGVPYRVSAALAGVHESSFHAWINRGKEEKARIEEGARPNPRERPFLEFLEDSTRARADGIAALVAKVRLHADHDFRAAAWLLERADPDNFSQRVMQTGPGGGPVKVRVVYEEDIEGEVDSMDVGSEEETAESATAENHDAGGADESHRESE